MIKRLSALAICLMLIFATKASAQTIVKVSGYTFPPFVGINDSEGITADFIDLLNRSQSEFIFVLHKTAPNRRYRSLVNKEADLILFEMPEWGWQDYSEHIKASKIFFIGGEVYIAQVKEGRGQRFFSTIGNKKIAAVFGYHYGFAGFSKDRKWLEKNFDIKLNYSPEDVIKNVEMGRADIGVVTQSYLARYLSDKPALASQLLISERKDQAYEMRAIVANHSPITVEQFNLLIDKIFASGALKEFAERRSLQAHLP